MNKFAILTLIVIMLTACAPVMPAKKITTNTSNQTMEKTPVVENKTMEKVNETPANTTMEETEEEKPDLRDIPVKEVTEGALVSFPNLKAVDPDGDPISYTFTEPLNDKGQWQTKEGDAGDHLVTITASDGKNVVSQQVLIRVKSKNRPPVIELEEPVEATEGETFTLEADITDPEGQDVNVSYSGWMTNDTKEVGYDEAGNHKVVITATDGKETATREVIISVKNTNRAPMLEEIKAQNIKEGQKVSIHPMAKDPDGDSVTFTYSDQLDQNGTWQTKVGDAGEYEITVTASDDDMTDEKTFTLTVESVNKAPVIEIDSPVMAMEGELVKLEPVITDPEGDEVRVSYSGWMNTDTKQTTYDDSGDHMVVITARDTAGNEARVEVNVSVEDNNRPPIFGAGSFS